MSNPNRRATDPAQKYFASDSLKKLENCFTDGTIRRYLTLVNFPNINAKGHDVTNCVFGKTVYTGNGVERNKYIFIDGKKISKISERGGGRCEKFEVVTPAFIDPHTHIGLTRAGEPSNEAEMFEALDSVLFLPDVLDSVQMDDQFFRDAIAAGVLYSCVLPGSGNIVGGMSAVIRNYAGDSSAALITRAGIKAALGHNVLRREGAGSRPKTRMGALGILRKKFRDAQIRIAQSKKKRGKNGSARLAPEDEVVRAILERRLVMRVHAHKIDDIASLLRFVDEFGIRVTVEHAGNVHDGAILRELKKRKIPVVYGPLDSFNYKVETKQKDRMNAGLIMGAGVEFGLMSDHPVCLQNCLLHQTRWFTFAGATKAEAVAIVTRRNAEILGIDKFLGTITPGKWASLVCWNGDPFDITNRPVRVVAEGRSIFELKPFGA